MLSISRISVVTRDENENENYYRTFSANENIKFLANSSLNLDLGLRTMKFLNFVGLTIVYVAVECAKHGEVNVN